LIREIKVTERASTIQYAIRDVMEFAEKLEKTGKDIIYLNIGDPVKFDFDTPEHVKRALIDAVTAGENWYGQSQGLRELRAAICRKEDHVNNVEISPDDVVVTAGVSEGIFMTMAAIIDGGDEILVPGPTYPPYSSYAKFFGGTPVSYRTLEEDGWNPDVDDLRSKISEKTKGIVIINPNNPCGAVYNAATVKQMINVAAENNLLVLSDEIYDRIVYEAQFVSTASLAKSYPVIGLNGFSKTYLATGWRLGYLYFYDPEEKLGELKESVKKETRIRLCSNTPVQRAGVAALNGPQDHIPLLVEKLRQRRDYAWNRLNEIPGISCTKPQGAFYIFPKIEEIGHRWSSDLDFVKDVLENAGVLLVHGSGFCTTYGSGHFRGVFLPPVETLENAFDRLERFMKT
jgi:alanine-synthesizing transaminase